MSVKDVPDAMVCWSYAIKIRGEWPTETLMRWSQQPPKVCARAIERSARKGFVEYGTSLRSGWLTAKGKELLT